MLFWMRAAIQSCINSIWSGICLVSQSCIAHIFYMNPWGIEHDNPGPDMIKRGLRARAYSEHQLSFWKLQRRKNPFWCPLARMFCEAFYNWKTAGEECMQTRTFSMGKKKNTNRAERGKETETRYSLSWLQPTVIKKSTRKTWGISV